jgi:glycosyltransferase involved in cell wall biosynthesis
MKNVLYIGNALSKKGKTITSVEVLGNFLSEFCNVKIASNKSNKVLRLLDMIWLVIKNRHQTDYILIDTYSTTNFYYAIIITLISILFKIKYIPILRGGNLEKRLIKNPRLSKLLFASAYNLVAPSAFLKSIFQKYGYNKIIFIPNTIDLDNYDFVNRPISDINLLWVRSFNKIYNPTLAIHVLKELASRDEKVTLTMVGPKSDESFSEAQKIAIAQKLDVNFTGKLSKKEWINLSKESNVFINTTNFDNTPVSVIEAMALGLPVVSTNVGGLPFLISHNEDGLLVPPDDVNAMVNAILSLKDHSNLKNKIVLNARKKVVQFDWKNVKTEWKELLS